MWEAAVGPNRTSVGLDVHARSVVACGLDGQTGEVFERRLTPDHREIAGWVRSLPGPVAVTYEAGPTGFGLARFLTGHGVACQVAAPSKLQRPCGDRVKTDLLTELPGRCAGRDVHARAGLARFPRHDQRRGLSPRELSELVVPLARSLEATGDLFLPYRLVDRDGVVVRRWRRSSPSRRPVDIQP
jgi:hypothetical protein